VRRGVFAAIFVVALVGGGGAALLRPDLIQRLSGAEVSRTPPSTGIQRSEAVVTPVDVAFDIGAIVDEPAAADSASAPPAPAGAAAEIVVSANPNAAEAATTAPPPAQSASQTAPEAEAMPAPAPTRVVRTGFLSVSASPGAEVHVDGVYRGDVPPALRLELAAGNHSIECRRPRHEAYRESLRIVPGELSTRSVTLKKLKGTVSLTTQAGAEVYVDGKLLGVTPFRQPLELDSGQHVISIKKPGFNTWSSQVSVQPKETLPLRITLSPRY
jgi:hypothetical protein